MFCSKCGTKLPDDAKFCVSCGTVTDGSVPPQQSTVAAALPDPKRIVLGILWRALVIVAAIILATGISEYFELYNANSEISSAIIGDYDSNGIASILFVGTPYFVCLFVLLIFLGALMRNSMWFIVPFIAYWITPFMHEEFNKMALENMWDNTGALCIYRATFYGLATDSVENLCKTALIFLIPAVIINFIYNILYPKKSIIQLIIEHFFPDSAKPVPASGVKTTVHHNNIPRPVSERTNDTQEQEKTWTCRKCGSRNSVYNESCKDCGAYK